MRLSRRLRCAIGCLGILTATSVPTVADAKTVVDVRAKTIAFFADRLGMTADGEVSVVFPGGMTVRADSLYADLRAEKYVLAGHVVARSHGTQLEAAAFSLDREAGRAYALELGDVPQTRDVSERLDGDLTVAPEGAFEFPDVNGIRPYIRSSHATIVPHSNVRFVPALFPTSIGITAPSPMYLYSFVANPNFGATTLGPSTFDQPYGLDGSPTAFTAAHFRYVSSTGVGLGLDQHFVYGQKAYVVGSISPLLSPNTLYGLLAYQRLGEHLTHQFQATLTNQNVAFPYNTESYKIIQGFSTSSVTFSASNFNTQNSADLLWQTYDRPLFLGATYRIRSNYGFDQNSLGLLARSAEPLKYPLIWRTSAGAFVASPLVTLPLSIRFNTTIDAKRTWFAYPHQQNNVTLTSTASRRWSKQTTSVATYIANFVNDNYPGKQTRFYPPPKLPYYAPDGTLWPGVVAYSGSYTQRAYALDTYYAPSPAFSAHMNLQRTRDFPQFHGYGRPINSAGLDLRIRLGATLGVTVGRGYYFNWARQTWSPQWIFSVTQ